MNQQPVDSEYPQSGVLNSHGSLLDVHSINSAEFVARLESYEGSGKKSISDVRRTFCLFVTFDFLFVALLWIIELNAHVNILEALQKEVLHYDYYYSFFDIFLLSFFRFIVLIVAYAICKLHHWGAVAVTTATTCAFLIVKVILSKLFSQGAFGYVLPIMSFILSWIEVWFLDFKVLPQEAGEENRRLVIQSVSERAALLPPGPRSDGQFYSPPESPADSDEDVEGKQDSEKSLI
ncbi:STARD3 N-terminal-like protein [Hyla sarda]|uniref:STARD3 N-terminal-like protein n=1 Tax=Hyla sarda TaxID=327740 RepID=UPI0024C3392C|nr:STARD3 N-terminal-like protein [Hyla sarda]XP_056376442.1 STARD3 N-terminal-like protein [Hyla sarda]